MSSGLLRYGKWTAEKKNAYMVKFEDDVNVSICVMTGYPLCHKERAQLISASPDMYDVCKLAIEVINRSLASESNFVGDDEHELLTAAIKAVAKAEGVVPA